MADIQELSRICSQVRRDIIRMTHAVQSGHPGGSLGCTEYLVCLYFDIMKYDLDFSMDGIGEDVFFLSNGHISPVLYSVMARAGIFPVDELSTFRRLNSRLQGHPATAEHLEGIRIASGSLGQGLSVALGAAVSKKMNKDPHLVFSLHGDGELQEGQIWEALLFGAHHKVDNIIMAIDFNNAQIDGPMNEVMNLGSISEKVRSFGWEVLETNGNSIEDVLSTLHKAKQFCGKGKPVSIILNTKMGYGVDFMEGSYKWHGVAPNDEQCAKALAQLEETLGDY